MGAVRLEEGRLGGADPDLVHAPTGFRIWFTRPIGIVTQMGHVHDVGDDLARFVSSRAQAWLDERHREGERFVYVHD